MLAIDAQNELAADREHGGQRRHAGVIRAQQQAQRQGGHERAARVKHRYAAEPACQVLGGLRGQQGSEDLWPAHADVQEQDGGGQQGRQHGDLVVARVGLRQSQHALVNARAG